jgi:cytochrome c
MDSFTFNKIAGSVLAALLAILGTNVLISEIYPDGKTSGHGGERKEIVVVEVQQPEPPADAAKKEAAAEAPPEQTVLALLAAAKPEDGESAAKKCAACHSFDKGGANLVGPNLYDIVGRAIGGVDGFNYSAALKGKGGEWTYESLDGFLKNPKEYIPGNKMAFAGLKKAEERAALISYLRSLSEAPKPLP